MTISRAALRRTLATMLVDWLMIYTLFSRCLLQLSCGSSGRLARCTAWRATLLFSIVETAADLSMMMTLCANAVPTSALGAKT